jgi:hypothetical protein
VCEADNYPEEAASDISFQSVSAAHGAQTDAVVVEPIDMNQPIGPISPFQSL